MSKGGASEPIARQLHVHAETGARVLAQVGLPRIGPPQRPLKIDPCLPFIREMLAKFPTLTASRLHAMACERGSRGGPSRFRAIVACHRPLHLHGLLAPWPEAAAAGWVPSLIEWEEDERARRSLERRLRDARISRFKPLCDFDWNWPTAIDRAGFEGLMTLDFLKDATNAVLVGPNGGGKSTLARNLAHEALIQGHTVLFTSAGQFLGELASLDSDAALRRRLRYHVAP